MKFIFDSRYIKPESKDDMPLFMHCSGGSIAVTEEFFNSDVQPLLFIHGVTAICIETVRQETGK